MFNTYTQNKNRDVGFALEYSFLFFEMLLCTLSDINQSISPLLGKLDWLLKLRTFISFP